MGFNDYKDARLIGKGNTAEVFEYDEGKICKLFLEGYSDTAIDRECTNAKLMEELKLPVPICYGIMKSKNRKGIIYERIHGKTLLENFIENGNVELLIDTLTDLHKKIIKNQTQDVMSYKTFLNLSIRENEIKDEELMQKIMGLPEGDYLCHGDYHPGNVLVGLDGQVSIIDFMNVCYGPWQYDVARTYYLIKNGEVPRETPKRLEILNMQSKLAELYLKKMNVTYDVISEYLLVIEKCRKYE